MAKKLTVLLKDSKYQLFPHPSESKEFLATRIYALLKMKIENFKLTELCQGKVPGLSNEKVSVFLGKVDPKILQKSLRAGLETHHFVYSSNPCTNEIEGVHYHYCQQEIQEIMRQLETGKDVFSL